MEQLNQCPFQTNQFWAHEIRNKLCLDMSTTCNLLPIRPGYALCPYQRAGGRIEKDANG